VPQGPGTAATSGRGDGGRGDGGRAATPGYDGAGHTVFVIDDGYSTAYDTSAIVHDYDFSGVGDGDASRDGWRSHGSWVADVVGDAAPGVDIVHLKVVPDDGSAARFEDIEEALAWSAANAERFNAVAVNLSLGDGNVTRAVDNILSDELAALGTAGVAVTVAAGNGGRGGGEGVTPFAADPNTIAVSGLDTEDRFAPWSQRHPEFTDIAARGAGVRVETAEGWGVSLSGTSFAAPYVAGAAAVLQDAASDLLGERLTPEEIVTILQASGRPVPGAEVEPAGYRAADVDAALDYFLDTYPDFAGDVVA
jgi:hypothetical protein